MSVYSRIELEFGHVDFRAEGKTGVPRDKPLRAEKRTNNKLNPHMTLGLGSNPGHIGGRQMLSLTSASSLLPQVYGLIALVLSMSSASLSPACGHCIQFFTKKLYCHSTSLLSLANFDLKGNPVVDKPSTQVR